MNLIQKLVMPAAALLFSFSAFAADRGTPAEAKAMLVKAVALMKTSGKDKALTQFMDKQGGFIDRDLYVSVIDLSGVTAANGGNPKLVGKDNMNYQDFDGKFIVKERIEIAKAKGQGSQEYRAMNPLTKEVESKLVFFEKMDNSIVAVGSYKP
ncbi:hypothetical protein BH09PSE6_BH09PSE6_03740 [soil metagenome]